MIDFCTDYIALAGRIAGWGEWLIAAAFVAVVVAVIADIVARFTPVAQPAAPGLAANSIKDVVDAFTGFLTALVKAPLWLALTMAGVLLFWIAGAAIPEACVSACKAGTACKADPNPSGGTAPGNTSSTPGNHS